MNKMKVHVKVVFYASLREKYKVREVSVECDGTIKNLVEKMSEIIGFDIVDDIYDRYKEKIRENLMFMINGRNIKDLGEDIELKDGDVISIFPPLAGG
jgi:molybdopterin synthase sulfur carrier subunit